VVLGSMLELPVSEIYDGAAEGKRPVSPSGLTSSPRSLL